MIILRSIGPVPGQKLISNDYFAVDWPCTRPEIYLEWLFCGQLCLYQARNLSSFNFCLSFCFISMSQCHPFEVNGISPMCVIKRRYFFNRFCPWTFVGVSSQLLVQKPCRHRFLPLLICLPLNPLNAFAGDLSSVQIIGVWPSSPSPLPAALELVL